MSMLVEAVVLGIPFVLYWFWALFFLMADVFRTPKWLQQRRLVPDQTALKAWTQFKAALPAVIRDQLAFLCLFLISAPLFRDRLQQHTRPTSVTDGVGFVVFAVLVHRVLFYYIHRLLHTPWLYRRVHYVHHRWTEPSSVVAVNAHPLENVVLNAGPVLLSVLVWPPDLMSLAIFLIWAVSQSCLDHSGYRLLDAGHHFIHHQKFTCNFGVAWLDQLHGTSYAAKPAL
jgi:methylsterol monooxygenase